MTFYLWDNFPKIYEGRTHNYIMSRTSELDSSSINYFYTSIYIIYILYSCKLKCKIILDMYSFLLFFILNKLNIFISRYLKHLVQIKMLSELQILYNYNYEAHRIETEQKRGYKGLRVRGNGSYCFIVTVFVEKMKKF